MVEEEKQMSRDPEQVIAMTYELYAKNVRNAAGRIIGVPGEMLADADITGYPDDNPTRTRAEWINIIRDAAEDYIESQDDIAMIRALFG
jgi:hypothetical protein